MSAASLIRNLSLVGAVIVLGAGIGGKSFGQFLTKDKPLKLDGQDFAFTVLTSPDGKDFGYFLPSARWPKSEDGSTTVYVCWENYSPEHATEHDLVKSAVTATWQSHSRLAFRGWEPCAERSSGVRIFISDEGPHTIGLGKQLDGKTRGMVLNFTFANWSQSCAEEREYCVKAIAVHEFGHAIGFAHEQNRPDKPGECREPPQGPSEGAVMLTPYDPHSVMNYCNEKYNNDGELSDLDVKALQERYGAHQ